MDYKVAAYITAYHDTEAIMSSVKAIQLQSYSVERIFIIDNSRNLSISIEQADSIIVEHHPRNIGVAGGLKRALDWSIGQNYDFLWALDQDSQPSENLLQALLEKYDELARKDFLIGIISPSILDMNTQQEFPGSLFEDYRFISFSNPVDYPSYYECDAVITSGALISIKSAKLVPLPNEKLFLDAVDYSYCMNFRNKGFKIIVDRNTLLKHCIGKYYQVKDKKSKSGQVVSTFLCSASRYYYACRNHTFVEIKLSSSKMLVKAIVHRLFIMNMFIERIVRYELDSVAIKVLACIIGTFDGLIGRIGKKW